MIKRDIDGDVYFYMPAPLVDKMVRACLQAVVCMQSDVKMLGKDHPEFERIQEAISNISNFTNELLQTPEAPDSELGLLREAFGIEMVNADDSP